MLPSMILPAADIVLGAVGIYQRVLDRQVQQEQNLAIDRLKDEARELQQEMKGLREQLWTPW